MASTESSNWADLPPELLALVLRRLPSLADRVRLRAVCGPWNSNARMHTLPPPLPWLSLLDGTFVSIPGGEVHRMPVPDDSCLHGSIDNWLFLTQSDGGCSLMNPLSKATLNLPKLATYWHSEWSNAASRIKPLFYKLVAPSPLDSSPDSLVAALVMDDGHDCTLLICQPPFTTDSSRRREPLDLLTDVAFFDGKLYAIAMFGDLVIIDISGSCGGDPKISTIEFVINSRDHICGAPQPLPRDEVYMAREYLVECGGRLMLVTRYVRFIRITRETMQDFYQNQRTAGFVVFEADLSSRPGRWRRINNLGGHALFVGKHCSRAFPAEETGGAQEDCIYFMSDYPPPEFPGDHALRDSGVYNMRNGMITPLLSGSAAAPPHRVGQNRPTWFFPTEAK